MGRVGRAIGLVSDVPVGDAEFDSNYLVTGAAGQIRSFFKSDKLLTDLLDRLTQRYNLHSIELVDGTLRFERSYMQGLDPGLLGRTFEALFDLAARCERSVVRVKVLGEEPRFALTGGSEGARCPYCHDSIDLEGEGVDACADCNTVHHSDCLEEAGGCTVFGCTGRRERERA